MNLTTTKRAGSHFAPNQIHCGDALQILSGYPSESADLVVTDPPYLCGYQDRLGRRIANDNNGSGVLPVYQEIYRLLKPNSYCVTFYGWTAIADFASTWQAAGFRSIGHIVWPKNYTSTKGFMNYQHESAFVLAKGYPAKPTSPIDDVQPWEYTGNKAHPTEKSVNIITPLIRSFSKPGDIVIDPFLGSGTTAVAAALTGRRYIGVELEAKYCKHAEQRLAGVKRYRQQA